MYIHYSAARGGSGSGSSSRASVPSLGSCLLSYAVFYRTCLYMCISLSLYVCIYIYIERERERYTHDMYVVVVCLLKDIMLCHCV